MSTYLQRLFDRAAGLAPGAAPALSPTFSSRSPVAEADQRLNVPDLAASLFALPPASLDPPLADDDGFGAFDDEPIAPTLRGPSSRAGRPGDAGPAPPWSPAAPLAAPTENRPPQWAPAPRPAAPPEPPPVTPRATPPEPAFDPVTAAPQSRSAPTAPPNARPPTGEHPTPTPVAEPAEPPPALQPIPQPPRPVPVTSPQPAAARAATAPEARGPSMLEPRPIGPAESADNAVVRLLEPAPLPEPEPLPAPAPPPRAAPEPRQPPVTRAEIVTSPVPEQPAMTPAGPVPVTAETVSRIGRLTPRRRTHLVFGLRRR